MTNCFHCHREIKDVFCRILTHHGTQIREYCNRCFAVGDYTKGNK